MKRSLIETANSQLTKQLDILKILTKPIFEAIGWFFPEITGWQNEYSFEINLILKPRTQSKNT